MKEKLFCYNCLKNQDFEIKVKKYPIVKDKLVVSILDANVACCTVCGDENTVNGNMQHWYYKGGDF